MKSSKILTLAAASLILVALSIQPVLAKQYSKEELLEMGGKTMSGKVTKVGVYNFFIKTSDSQELNIHTDVGTTQFSPEDERLMIGDDVSFVYTSPESASLSTDKTMAQYIEFVNKVPRIFLTDEMECIVSLSKRNEKACYLPQHDKTVNFEGRWPEEKYQGREIRTSPGSRLLIKLKVVPANIGNGYVYKIKEARPLEN